MELRLVNESVTLLLVYEYDGLIEMIPSQSESKEISFANLHFQFSVYFLGASGRPEEIYLMREFLHW